MTISRKKVLALPLSDVLSKSFVQSLLEKKRGSVRTASAKQLASLHSRTIVAEWVLKALTTKACPEPRVSDLVRHTPAQVREMTRLGDTTLRWLEEYLHLLGVTLSKTKHVPGVSEDSQRFLDSL